MHKYLKFGVIENLETTRRIRIGQFWDIPLFITPQIWLGPFIFFGLHFILNLINPRLGLTERLTLSIYFTLAVEITTVLHAFGHILSGKLVHNAMDKLLMTAIRDINIYEGDQSLIPGYVHLARALGGPLFNLLIAAVCISVAKSLPIGFWSSLNTSLISTNLFFGIGGFLPLRSIDGEVIWREVANYLRSKK